MISRFFLYAIAGLMLLGSAGCGIKARVYPVDRPRVDQVNMGNAGYIGGEKKEDEPKVEKSTRRIYVFEFDKKKQEVVLDAKKAEASFSSSQTAAKDSQAVSPSKKGISVPYIGDDEPTDQAAAANETPVNAAGMPYTVMKDDTLQKISKKVYGSYGKWTRIYDANKDKIKNPNFVKPGTILAIPSIE